MTATVWTSIGIALWGAFFAVGFWLLRRLVSRVDLLEQEVHGETGVRERFAKYVTHESLTQRLATLDAQMKGISEEGQRREERILAAIQNQTLVIGSEVREIKEDLRAQAQRVDQVMLRGGS